MIENSIKPICLRCSKRKVHGTGSLCLSCLHVTRSAEKKKFLETFKNSQANSYTGVAPMLTASISPTLVDTTPPAIQTEEKVIPLSNFNSNPTPVENQQKVDFALTEKDIIPIAKLPFSLTARALNEPAWELTDSQAQTIAPSLLKLFDKYAPAYIEKYGIELICATVIISVINEKINDVEQAKKKNETK